MAPPASPPGWVRAADLLVVLLFLLACWIAITGGARYMVLGIVVPFASVGPILFAIAALLVIRHVAVPRPTILTRARAGRARLAETPAIDTAITLTAATRLPVLVVGFLAVLTVGFAKPPGLVVSSDPLTNLPARFDAGWYADIALDGYERGANFGSQRNTAFFPALPLLMRPVGALFGAYAAGVPHQRAMARMLWAGVAISLVAFMAAVYYIMRLGEDLLGPEPAVSAALLFATYPFAVFFSAPYTESLFVASAAGAFVHLGRSQLLSAALWGALAGSSRPNGCLLSVPLALLVTRRLGSQLRSGGAAVSWRTHAARFGVAAMPVVSMLAFTAYLQSRTGVWFAWARSHEAWGRGLAGPDSIAAGYALLREEGLARAIVLKPYDSLNTAAALFAIVMVWPVFRRLGVSMATFVVINLAPAILSGGALSVGRVTSTLFPIFLALAMSLSPRGVAAWAAAFAIVQGFVAVLFFTWRELF